MTITAGYGQTTVPPRGRVVAVAVDTGTGLGRLAVGAVRVIPTGHGKEHSAVGTVTVFVDRSRLGRLAAVAPIFRVPTFRMAGTASIIPFSNIIIPQNNGTHVHDVGTVTIRPGT